MPQGKPPSPNIRSAIQRHGLATLSVAIALGAALLLQSSNVLHTEFPLFLLAISIVAWYAGTGPGILAVVLSGLAFDYFFVPPVHTFYITTSDLPYWASFILFASLITWFSAVRHGVERRLLQAQDELQKEVAERTQQASLLNLTHDTIFVRNLSDVITYWNRGAHELYGWTAEQAIGHRSHDFLRTISPTPLEQVQAELLRTGRWEGELEHTKADGSSVVVASRWSLQRDQHDRPTAVLETNNDITQRKRGEDEIRKLNQELGKRTIELEAINKELGAFAYSISHDLRAPLRHMAGYTELLQKTSSSVVDEKGRRYMTMILESAKRMGTLIDDLLAFFADRAC